MFYFMKVVKYQSICKNLWLIKAWEKISGFFIYTILNSFGQGIQ